MTKDYNLDATEPGEKEFLVDQLINNQMYGTDNIVRPDIILDNSYNPYAVEPGRQVYFDGERSTLPQTQEEALQSLRDTLAGREGRGKLGAGPRDLHDGWMVPGHISRSLPTATPNEESERMQRFKGRTGSGGDDLGVVEEGPGRFDALLELYDQLHASDTGAAKQYLSTIQQYIGDAGAGRAGQIQSDTDAINRQLDEVFAATEERDKNNDLRFEAEFQTAIDGMEDTQEAAELRLGTWGIDPQRWVAGAGAETAALLTSQAMDGARFANEMGAIMKMAHGMATARVNQGMAAEARNLANTVSQLGLQAQLNYQNNIQQIDRELLMNKIGVEQASMALDAANEQAEADSAAALQAYQIMAAATNTSSQLWYGADQLELADDLFERTPMIPEIPDNTRPWGGLEITPEGLGPKSVFYSSPAELQQVLETYLKMHSG